MPRTIWKGSVAAAMLALAGASVMYAQQPAAPDTILVNGKIITDLDLDFQEGEIFEQQQASTITAIEATERSVVFKINLMDFYFVLANHHELVQGLIRNITEDKTIAEEQQ